MCARHHFFVPSEPSLVEITLLRNFKPANGLPDPKVLLSTTISPHINH